MTQAHLLEHFFIKEQYTDLTSEKEDIKEEIQNTYEDITIKQETIESSEQTINQQTTKQEIYNVFEDISIKQESPNSLKNLCIDATNLKKIKESQYKIISANTISTNSNISTETIGEFEVNIPDITDEKGGWLTRYSRDNKLYHVKSGPTGQFIVNTKYQNIKSSRQNTFFIRSVLIKKNSVYRVYPVNKLCDKHNNIENHYDYNNPIQAAIMTPKCEYAHSQTHPRSSMIH